MSPPSKKRIRDDDDATSTTLDDVDDKTASRQGGTSTNFRNVSACNRCRHRKNRCDQQLPRCSACVKADALCVGFDPVSKREIPRSYVYFLETRLRNLEAVLHQHNIPIPPPEESFPIDETIRPGVNVPFPPIEGDGKVKADRTIKSESTLDPALQGYDAKQARVRVPTKSSKSQDLRQLLPQTTMQPPGLSFSKVVFAAVRNSVSQTASERGGAKISRRTSVDHSSHTAQDCFFGLHTRPTVKPAPFPDRELGLHLVNLYFEHANPQIPILHRGEYMQLFDKVYGKPEGGRTARELYLLKIVFAVGAGIIMDGTGFKRTTSTGTEPTQRQPEEYHASAVTHLETFLHCPTAMDDHSGGMEELQAVLLLAALALLRPVAPGLWYIVGVAVRLAVDLGLHFEQVDAELDKLDVSGELAPGSSLGKKQWKRDLRRRLWWCVYSYDRLVSTCVGRPFNITDQVITTDFPSLLPDEFITKDGFTKSITTLQEPTYKLVTHHYVRLRLLQSEILQVLQYRQAQRVRAESMHAANEYMHNSLPSPFLHQFSSFRDWRADVDRRLGEWRDDAPTGEAIGVSFKPLFLELNYWQAVILLYRQSLAVPPALAKELPNVGDNVLSPGAVNHELEQDKQQVLLKIAQAGQMVIKTYVQLHRLKLVNYTFLATHHIFMSGVSFLYALWNSPPVRFRITHDDVDFVTMAATAILTDLIDKCPPAEACRDAFQRMSKAAVAMVVNTTGFGAVTTLGSVPVETPGSTTMSPSAAGNEYFSPQSVTSQPVAAKSASSKRVLPAFDMDLKSLFQDNDMMRSAARGSASPLHTLAPIQSPQTAYTTSAAPPYTTLASISQAQTALSMENLDFMNAFILDDGSQQYWAPGYELDPSFGAGGTAGGYDDASWDSAPGLDILNGFYFGNGPGVS